MASVSKVRISLRSDDLSNWESKNPVLNNGELAIVRDTNSNVRFKIGDGTTAFKQLPYVNENELETNSAVVKSLAQGLRTKATPLGLAAGAFLSANADFSQAFGYNAETKADDTYAFVWNGDAERALFDYYQSHGPGTFNINPAEGLSGAYIGEQSLAEILSAKLDRIVPEPNNDDYIAFVEGNGNVQRSNVQLSSLETVAANVRPTYYIEFDSPLGYGSLFPVKFKNIDPYDGYWEFYQTYERREGLFDGTVDLIEIKDQGSLLCCYLKSSPTSPTQIEGDILSAENLHWNEFEETGVYEFTMMGQPVRIALKTYYDANSYSRASIDKLFAQKFQLSNYYDKTETSSQAELTQKFSTLQTYSEIHNELSNDGYLTEQQFRWGNITGDMTNQQDLQQVFDNIGTKIEHAEDSIGTLQSKVNDNTSQIGQIFNDIVPTYPSTDAYENALAGAKATADFVNSSINNFAAFYITMDAAGNAFPTKTSLLDATVFYSGGKVRIPTQNDYCIVMSDESHINSLGEPTTRYTYQGTYPNGQWDFQYVVNNTSLTQAQVNAINSGITSQKVAQIDNMPTKVSDLPNDAGYALSSWVDATFESKSKLSGYNDTLLSGITEDNTEVSFYILTKGN